MKFLVEIIAKNNAPYPAYTRNTNKCLCGYVRTSQMQCTMAGKSRDWREPISAMTSSVTLGVT